MVQQNNTVVKTIYKHYSTNNQSFLDMHYFLKAKGIKNNDFHLTLFDPDLAGIDPRDPRLNVYMKQKVLRECVFNYWYFVREIVRIPMQGGQVGGGAKYKLHRGNLALGWAFTNNLNTFTELPRQQYKTVSVLCRILWEYNFGTTNSETMFINKKHEDSKMNLKRLKELREALPSYLQMTDNYSPDGKKLRVTDKVEMIENPSNHNKIRTLPSAKSKVLANQLGRGCTQPRLWYDEFAFIPHVKIVYLSATPAYKTASMNAKANNKPYGITLTTTPGDLTTEEGQDAFAIMSNAIKFDEGFYNMTPIQLNDMISSNNTSNIIYIRFTYQQLGLSEEWFREMVIEMQKDWPTIRREVLLEWSTSSDNSPFSKEDLNIVGTLVKEPINTVFLTNKAYQLYIYEQIDLRYPPIIGVDVSGGYQKDSSAITIIDSKTTRVIACLNCNYITTTDLAMCVYEIVTRYMQNAVVNVERNGGFGASVLAHLVNSSIKRNLYYEIKDRVIEERSDGIHTIRNKQKVKVYGLDSSKNTRELLIELLRKRMEGHKDKFISPIIYHELETLEVKKNGKVEHTSTGHDDQIFSYLLAIYVWYEGQDLRNRFGIEKGTIKCDTELDEAVFGLGSGAEVSIIDGIDEPNEEVSQQLEYLSANKTMLFDQWRDQQEAIDEAAMQSLLQTKLGQMAYKQTHATTSKDIGSGMTTIPMSVFSDINDNILKAKGGYTDGTYTQDFDPDRMFKNMTM